MQMKNIFHLFLVFSLATSSCWKKQSHEVEAPEIPRYDISGVVTDIDSNEPLVNAIITLDVVTLFHETEFTAVADTTDSSGSYLFKNIVPGRYTLLAKRDKYVVLEKEIVQQYEPKVTNLQLPKALLSKAYFPVPACFSFDMLPVPFQGIHWIYANKLAGVVTWKPGGLTDNPTSAKRIALGNFNEKYQVITEKTRYWPENPDFHGLTFLSNYWAVSTEKPSYIYEINQGNSKVLGQTKITWEISDLATDGSHIWASTYNGKILKFGKHPSFFYKEYQLVDEHFMGIAWSGTHIWTSNSNDNLVMKHDTDMKIVATYRPVILNDFYEQIENEKLSYLCFDYKGYLWAVTTQGTCQFEKK